jgi:ubiquinone/menaquinone biosynthesis C-methylase UbiE
MGHNWYERHVLPWLVDFVCSRRPFRRQRQKVVPLATGRVLEIGIGTGLNLEHYDRARIGQLVGLDPGVEMHPRARQRSRRIGLAIEVIGLSAERIPFDDSSFDTVVVTYALCSIADPATALKEMHRVLKPGGRLIFCEHGLAPDVSVRGWQGRLTPLWSKVAGGCHLDRDVPRLLQEAGFQLDDLQQMYLPGPRAVSYNYWGTAVRAAGATSSAACSRSG